MQEILFKAKRKDWRNLPKGEWWVEECIAQIAIVFYRGIGE